MPNINRRLDVDTMMLILQFCNTSSLTRCAACCRAFQGLVAIELRRRYFAVLQWFFAYRARDFHIPLGNHRGLISGSAALAFLAWTDTWGPGDMDVYVPENLYSPFVDDLERSHLAFLEHDFSSRPHPVYHGIKHVRRYITFKGERLDIIQSTTGCAASPLLYFWTSAVVNFLSPDGVVCAYPTSTLNARTLIGEVIPSEKLILAQRKYESRGYEFTSVARWGPSPDNDVEDPRVFSEDAMMVLDFETVWFTRPSRFPVMRSQGGWSLN